jgi:hypothetical protein
LRDSVRALLVGLAPAGPAGELPRKAGKGKR